MDWRLDQWVIHCRVELWCNSGAQMRRASAATEHPRLTSGGETDEACLDVVAPRHRLRYSPPTSCSACRAAWHFPTRARHRPAQLVHTIRPIIVTTSPAPRVG